MRKPIIITDAHESLLFTVTKQDAKGSVVGDPGKCAGARALGNIPGVKRAEVRRTRTIVEFEDGRVMRWTNPASLRKAVETFDITAGTFPPGIYELRPVPPSQSMENQARHGKRERPDPAAVKHRHRSPHVLR